MQNKTKSKYPYLILQRRKKHKGIQKTDLKVEQYYNPFWYSLDLFLPFIDLKMSGVWQPKEARKFVRHYARIHTIIGYILIPIGLLAVTGLIG